MGDEEVGEAQLLLQVLEEVHHLRLDGDVEGGDRFVADHELGVEGDGPGDAYALALASGELVGVAAHGGGVEAHALQEGGHALLALPAPRDFVDGERLAHGGPDGHARVQRGVGVLEDDLHIAPAPSHGGAVQGEEVLPLEEDLAGGGLLEAEDAPTEGGLAGAGLAHEAEGLALLDAEGDAVDGPHVAHGALEEPPPDGEALTEVADFDEEAVGARIIGVHGSLRGERGRR